ncbi:MAG: hypothetical protein A3G78_04470 [Alphaproteobacteria bacterium RIFCSPLOWO2_12_FULL_42_29]|nr:MAG: hypothetical protein A2Z80_07210 [Alphaproteobacteria bacterium GWA2_41_27]OFW84463.1 MAG: hypothetical protein A3E50_07450 [Alphaproteobacteria bacterium RIFCSPHIGHO2_12_FULL_42_100]OFX06084.1 MAG: hypothetical protein A3H46_00085 [Alphaproteobacteria bacterium RIFCSPLOWO2_02_FULL_43_54]OFX08448.1 MAG: hypothetical protein A3G78_04470 [Alphaproteobacteria bacterium RIFCSPLOWO2_12_FULL_42_29]
MIEIFGFPFRHYLENLCRKRDQTYTCFDYFGHGISSGDFIDGTIGQWLSDVLAIIDEVTKGPLILVGSSMGGWLMTLAALARPERMRGLIGIAVAPDFTEELIWAPLTDAQKSVFKEQGLIQKPVCSEELDYSIAYALVEEGRKHLLLSKPILLSCPVHLIHGTADEAVPWTFSKRLAEKLQSPDVTVTLIKNGDHRLNIPLVQGRIKSLIHEISQSS